LAYREAANTELRLGSQPPGLRRLPQLTSKMVLYRPANQDWQESLHSCIGESGEFTLDESSDDSRVGRCPPAPAPLDDLDHYLVHQPRTIHVRCDLCKRKLHIGRHIASFGYRPNPSGPPAKHVRGQR
jgi:hypothetical protein